PRKAAPDGLRVADAPLNPEPDSPQHEEPTAQTLKNYSTSAGPATPFHGPWSRRAEVWMTTSRLPP
ncbi:MAG: hypothetical protein ACO2PN_13880, partial [Pyrobaculum sp.]